MLELDFTPPCVKRGFLHEGLAKVDHVKLRWHELERTMWDNVGGNIQREENLIRSRAHGGKAHFLKEDQGIHCANL